MISDRLTSEIVAAFDAAAETYDSGTRMQRDVARAVVARAAREARDPATVLDLGAGTGHVVEFALRQWPRAALAALDAAPAMLARLHRKWPEVEAIRGDATRLDGLGGYDLILSSMMAHWLDDPRAALVGWRRHLAPGGLLCVATPVAGSLLEWRDLTASAGIEDRLWSFPRDNFADGLGASVDFAEFPVTHPDARAFLRSLKSAGAHKSRAGVAPASAGALRRLLAARTGAFTTTFRIAFVSLRAEAER
jgi:malonyl-CoA O-methyltransferase